MLAFSEPASYTPVLCSDALHFGDSEYLTSYAPISLCPLGLMVCACLCVLQFTRDRVLCLLAEGKDFPAQNPVDSQYVSVSLHLLAAKQELLCLPIG